MANIKTLYGSDKLREMYPKVNENFNAVNGEVSDLRRRVNNIITTPIDGEAAAQELVDARQSAVKEKTFETLDARIEEAEQDHKTHLAENVTQDDTPHGLVYEEGTFTPEFITTGDGFTTINYATQTGGYIRIGNMVYITLNIATSNVVKGSASGSIRIGGLPFTPKASSGLAIAEARRLSATADSSLWKATASVLGLISIYKNNASSADPAEIDISDILESSLPNRNRIILSGAYSI